jgi:hypothetical protein
MLATITRVGSMAASHRNMLSLWERALLATDRPRLPTLLQVVPAR